MVSGIDRILLYLYKSIEKISIFSHAKRCKKYHKRHAIELGSKHRFMTLLQLFQEIAPEQCPAIDYNDEFGIIDSSNPDILPEDAVLLIPMQDCPILWKISKCRP